jgi:restriction system protein
VRISRHASQSGDSGLKFRHCVDEARDHARVVALSARRMDAYPFRTRRSDAEALGRLSQRVGWGLGAVGLVSLAARDALGHRAGLGDLSSLLPTLGWATLGLGLGCLAFAWFDRRRAAPGLRTPDLSARAASSALPPRPVPLDGLTQFPETVMVPGRSDTQTAALDAQTDVRPTAWSMELLRTIEWRRFEAVCAAVFSQAGLEARPQAVNEGGIDLWLYSRHKPGDPVTVVRCRQWVEEGQLQGVLDGLQALQQAHKLTRVTLLTLSRLPEALRHSLAQGTIRLLDGEGLLGLITQRHPDQQAQLLAIATEGEYRRPTCAKCGIKMNERTDKAGTASWVCVHAPRCKHTLPQQPA